MSFKLLSENPRKGILTVRGRSVETPFFMPVATKATGKSITSDDYKRIGIKAIICNSLHLEFVPGSEVIRDNGGLHNFMNYQGVIFTDSGGFQASSKFFKGKVKKGLVFNNPYTTGTLKLTPEKAMQIQHNIGSDVAMVLDDMAPYGASYEEAKQAMLKTHEWALQSLEAHKKLEEENPTGQLLFGIIQGNFYEDLRKESAKFITSLPFDGFAIGGLAIGETQEEMLKAIEWVKEYLPEDKPRYVMGVGKPEDMKLLIENGIDCFDSIYPTKNARHGTMLTKDDKMSITKGRYKYDQEPIEKSCECHTCKNYSKAYLNHLTKIKDPSGYRLRSIHNLNYLNKEIKKIRG